MWIVRQPRKNFVRWWAEFDKEASANVGCSYLRIWSGRWRGVQLGGKINNESKTITRFSIAHIFHALSRRFRPRGYVINKTRNMRNILGLFNAASFCSEGFGTDKHRFESWDSYLTEDIKDFHMLWSLSSSNPVSKSYANSKPSSQTYGTEREQKYWCDCWSDKLSLSSNKQPHNSGSITSYCCTALFSARADR